jgi:hypothetical protein
MESDVGQDVSAKFRFFPQPLGGIVRTGEPRNTLAQIGLELECGYRARWRSRRQHSLHGLGCGLGYAWTGQRYKEN